MAPLSPKKAIHVVLWLLTLSTAPEQSQKLDCVANIGRSAIQGLFAAGRQASRMETVVPNQCRCQSGGLSTRGNPFPVAPRASGLFSAR
jgi:hypothetical protein